MILNWADENIFGGSDGSTGMDCAGMDGAGIDGVIEDVFTSYHIRIIIRIG